MAGSLAFLSAEDNNRKPPHKQHYTRNETNHCQSIIFGKLCLQSSAAKELNNGIPGIRIMREKLINLVADGFCPFYLILGVNSHKNQGNAGGGEDQSTDLFYVQLQAAFELNPKASH